MKRTMAVILALFALGIIAAPGSAQQTTVLRLGHVGGPGSAYDIVATKFATRVHDSLKGRVEIKVSGGSQLGSDEQVIRGIKVGAPEMAVIATVMESVEPRYGVFELPYLIGSRAQMKKVVEHPKVQAALFEGLPAKGMRVLSVWENGFRHVTNNVRPVEKPEDLKGLTLRVPSGAWRVKLFKAYGAKPSPMPLNEVFAALKNGVVDGQENPMSQIAGLRFQEVQKFLSLTKHVYTPAVLVVSEESWKKLPKDAQDTLAKIAWELGDFARAEGERLDKELLGKLAPPMKANEVQKEAFIKASAGIYQEFSQQVAGGNELISVMQSLR